jgi:hypothetical protein
MKHLIIDVFLAPTLGIIIGALLLFLVGYTNWRKNSRERILQWIRGTVFRNSRDSEQRAVGLFGVLTSLMLATGLTVILAGVFILTNAAY